MGIPDDIWTTATAVACGLTDRCAGHLPGESHSMACQHKAEFIAQSIMAERQRCADWCDKTAFLEWEQGEVRAQRALKKARECILSGDDT